MDDLISSTTFPLAGTQAPPAVAPDTVRVDDHRQLRRLQQWRASLEADGYQTMLSAVPPCGLIVRDKRVSNRWLALAPDRSIVVFRRDSAGQVRTQQLVVEALGIDSDAASALVVSAMVRRFLDPDRR